jgi:hypothetical protein
MATATLIIGPRQPFSVDAFLTYNPHLPWSGHSSAFSSTLADWRNKIESEGLQDFGFEGQAPIEWSKLFLSPDDGAILRDPRGKGFAYTPHAWGQLISLLLQGLEDRPSGAAGPFGWLWPKARALAFESCVTRSKRSKDHTMVFRTFLHTLHTGATVRALRAVVSQRHAGRFYDDLAVAEFLEREVEPSAASYVHRSLNHTYGWVALESGQELNGTLHFENSEVGASSLKFVGGARVRFLDVGFRARGDGSLDATTEQEIQLAVAKGSARTSHTLPKSGLTDVQREEIAGLRMEAMMRKARVETDKLRVSWTASLVDMNMDVHTAANAGGQGFEALLDAAEEAQGMEAGDKVKLMQLLLDDRRLGQVPRTSAAHMACCYAVLSAKAESHSEMSRLADAATQWLTQGWKR